MKLTIIIPEDQVENLCKMIASSLNQLQVETPEFKAWIEKTVNLPKSTSPKQKKRGKQKGIDKGKTATSPKQKKEKKKQKKRGKEKGINKGKIALDMAENGYSISEICHNLNLKESTANQYIYAEKKKRKMKSPPKKAKTPSLKGKKTMLDTSVYLTEDGSLRPGLTIRTAGRKTQVPIK